jgi:hypothetical protein
MDYEGYKLYELLDDGEAHTITHNGETYTLRFVGERIGSESYLSALDSHGQEKRFGWGWGSEQVYQALNHLEKGWGTPQVPRYKPYDEKAETRGVTEWVDVKRDY